MGWAADAADAVERRMVSVDSFILVVGSSFGGVSYYFYCFTVENCLELV